MSRNDNCEASLYFDNPDRLQNKLIVVVFANRRNTQIFYFMIV